MRHNPRCAIFHDPPGLRDDGDCNCGAIPPLPTRTRSERERRLERVVIAILEEFPSHEWEERIAELRRRAQVVLDEA
jgi:hypothetical protein